MNQSINERPKLSQAQRKAMSYLSRGYLAVPGSGIAVMINGKVVCTSVTMESLTKKGLVKAFKDGWRATDAGTRYLELPVKAI